MSRNSPQSASTHCNSLLWTVSHQYHIEFMLNSHRIHIEIITSQVLCFLPCTAAEQLDRALHPNSQVCYSIQFVGLLCILEAVKVMDLMKIAPGKMLTCFKPKQALSSMCSESAQDSFCVSAPQSFSGNSIWICDAKGVCLQMCRPNNFVQTTFMNENC